MKKKNLLILLVICSIIFITTGTFAYYRYSVNGSIIGKASNYTFNVTSNSTTTKDINLGSNLKPFDKGSFNLTVKLDNTDCDAYYTLKIEKTNLPKGFKFLSQDDNISPFSTYSKYFNASDTKTDIVTIYWYWDGNVDDKNDNSFIGKSISANIVINSKQVNPAYMKNGYSSSSSANGGTEFWNNIYKPYVRTINFGNDLSNLPSSCTEENLCWDISESQTQKKKVYGYLVDTGLKDSTDNTKSLYNLYIVSEAQIFAPSYCYSIFSFSKYENSKYISNLISINFNDNFNTLNVTNMGSMFKNCTSLTSLNLSNFNTTNVRDISTMFRDCSSLTNLDLSNFNTSKVTGMIYMFENCKSLKSLDLSVFNTANITYMSAMFQDCSSLKSLDLSSFNTSKVTNMSLMFNDCSSLTSLDLSNFNTANVTNMNGMFNDCSSITSLDLSNFNTANVTNMNGMFYYCSSLTSLDLSSFNTAIVTNMSYMFSGCSSLKSLDLSSFNTAIVTNMSYMFSGCSSLTSLDLSSFNTAIVTNMGSMFSECSSLTSLDLSNFNTTNVTNMGSMFSRCSSLTSLDLSSFNTAKVTDISYMFYSCSKLQTEITITGTSITNYAIMFGSALTDTNAYVIINYSSEAESIAQGMKLTASTSNQSKITLKQI